MSLKKRTSVLFIGFLAFYSLTFAQKKVFYDDFAVKGEYSVCAWDRADLFDSPGRNSDVIATVHFSEEVLHLGREAFVRGGENNNYVLVETEDGREGWINDQYFVTGGGNIVLLKNTSIFEKPSTPNSISKRSFRAGELAILTEFTSGWVKLTGKEKRKMGWVQGYDAISTQDHDIEAAALIDQALAERNVDDRRDELRKIRDSRSFLSPEMRQVIEIRLEESYNTTRSNEDDEEEYYVDDNDTDYYAEGEDYFADKNENTEEFRSDDRGTYQGGSYIKEREVVDSNTGESYIRITETGTIQPVEAKNPRNIYYAYHKYLPKGSYVLLEVPGTKKFVKLEIIASLKQSNKHMIGLGAEVIKAVYGETQAKNVPSATISYPKY